MATLDNKKGGARDGRTGVNIHGGLRIRLALENDVLRNCRLTMARYDAETPGTVIEDVEYWVREVSQQLSYATRWLRQYRRQQAGGIPE